MRSFDRYDDRPGTPGRCSGLVGRGVVLTARRTMRRVAALCIVAVACSEDATGIGGAGGEAAGVGGGAGGQGGKGGAEGGGASPAPLFVNAFDRLYAGDSSSSPLALVDRGRIDCVPDFEKGVGTSVQDIAVDAQGRVWALLLTAGGHASVSAASVTQIDLTRRGVAHCVDTVSLDPPDPLDLMPRYRGLTLAPKGVLAPDQEVLLASTDQGEIWSVAPHDSVAARGTLGPVPADDGHGHPYAFAAWSASDLAFYDHEGGPLGYAVARDCAFVGGYPAECGSIDTLLEIDLAALGAATDQPVVKRVVGQIVRRAGCNDDVASYTGIDGLALWRGVLYGFAGSRAIEIDREDGSGCGVDPAVSPALQDGRVWIGAATSTSAFLWTP